MEQNALTEELCMLLETDFNSGREEQVTLDIDREQHEKLPIDMSSFPYMCRKNILDEKLGSAVPWHWHNVFELNYVLEGELLWKTNDATNIIKKGELFFVNNGVHHTCMAAGEDRCVYYTILFDMHLLSGMYSSVFEEKYFLPVMRNEDLIFWHVKPDSLLHLKIIENVLKVVETGSSETFGYEFEVRNLLGKFWLLFLQDTEKVRENAIPRSAADTERLKLMTHFIQEHCTEKLTLEDVASAADISTRECTRCFRRGLNSSPIVYLTQTRVRLAAQMLTETSKSVIEISEDCGFSSPSYFSKVFREIMDCTPKDYRAQKTAG